MTNLLNPWRIFWGPNEYVLCNGMERMYYVWRGGKRTMGPTT
jgi:hypothetical protein